MNKNIIGNRGADLEYKLQSGVHLRAWTKEIQIGTRLIAIYVAVYWRSRQGALCYMNFKNGIERRRSEIVYNPDRECVRSSISPTGTKMRLCK